MELISSAKFISVFFLQEMFWNYSTTYICNHFRRDGTPCCFHDHQVVRSTVLVEWEPWSEHVGGAEVAAWEASLEMESLDFLWE